METPARDTLTFFINGRKINLVNPDPAETLLRYLRYKARLVGTKESCGEGACGACTVVVSFLDKTLRKVRHRSQAACLTPLVSLHGREVTTIEGLGNTESGLHPIQEQLAVSNGAQCGFCSPGMVMAMYGLLKNNDTPSVQDMEAALSGNLCRCTGYRSIVEGFQSFCKVPDIEDVPKKPCYVKYDQEKERCKSAEIQERLREFSADSQNVTLVFGGPGTTWYQPSIMKEVLTLIKDLPHARIISGATTLGFLPKKETVIAISRVEELRGITVKKDCLKIGAGVTVRELVDFLTEYLEGNDRRDSPGREILQAMLKTLHQFDGSTVANVGTIGGNTAGASPTSDINVFLLATGSEVVSRGNEAVRSRIVDSSFFKGYRNVDIRSGDVIDHVTVPLTNQEIIVDTFTEKTNSVCVKVVFLISVEDGSPGLVKDARFAFQGIRDTPVLATKAQKCTIGRAWTADLCSEVQHFLQDELAVPAGIPGESEEYRNALISGLFLKFYAAVAQKLEKQGRGEVKFDSSALLPSGKRVRQSVQVFEKPSPENPNDAVGSPILHVAANTHVTGQSIFIDDIPFYQDELQVALVQSSKPHARLLAIDTSVARELPGVATILTGNDADIPTLEPPLFAKEEVLHEGQCIAAVLAKSKLQALEAAKMVRVDYEVLPHILTIQEAIDVNSFHTSPWVFPPDCHQDPLAGFDHVIEGEFETASQKPLYMETQSCVVIPLGENGEMDVFVASQNPAQIHAVVAEVLGVDKNKVSVKIRRLGGGFGGKDEPPKLIYSIAALGARRTKQPVRCVLSRREDMLLIGGRHPLLTKYKVGFNDKGKISAVDLTCYADAGYNEFLFPHVPIQATLIWMVTTYGFTRGRLTTFSCKTNRAPNHAVRATLTAPGQMAIEHCVRHVAEVLDLAPEKVVELNLIRDGEQLFTGQRIEDATKLTECYQQVKTLSDFEEKKKEIMQFNKASRWRKRGIAIVPNSFVIGLLPLLTSAAVSIYKDGSVLIHCGGVEMGQGLFTKLIQIATRVLGIQMSKIHIKQVHADVTPEPFMTIASLGSDLNGMAVKNGCEKLMAKLAPFKQEQPDGTWEDWVNAAYNNGVALSATGSYWEPPESFKPTIPGGRSGVYLTYGAGCAEIELDVLTGQVEVLKVDILMDVGKSLNPAIDIGQIEGAFLMGYGLFMSEEVRYSPTGKLLTTSVGNYRIPQLKDIPLTLNVHLLKDRGNPRAVYSSKAIGEPPLFLGTTVYFATKMAVASAREDAGLRGYFRLKCPATQERIRLACGGDLSDLNKA